MEKAMTEKRVVPFSSPPKPKSRTVSARAYIKVRGKDEYRARTEHELQTAAAKKLAANDRRAYEKLIADLLAKNPNRDTVK
jgi:hypothetical protein